MNRNSIKQEQVLKQKLSHQNIQLFKMMELNLLQFDQKVKEELDLNPALENLDEYDSKRVEYSLDKASNDNSDSQATGTDAYIAESPYEKSTLEYDNYQTQRDYNNDYNRDEEERDLFIPVVDNDTLLTSLSNQLQYANLSDDQMVIGEYLIGSIDDDGYLRRPLESVVDDLSFRQNFHTNIEDVEEVLDYIQDLDPPGIAARNLQECLILQLRRKKYSKNVEHALNIVTNLFDLYSRKQLDRIIKKLKITEEDFNDINKIILSLNPKPTEKSDNETTLGKYIIPDFIVYRNDNKLELELHSYNQPNLTINPEFVNMLKKIKAEKKKSIAERAAQEYVTDKINKASLFLSLIKERHETMVIIMNTIIDLQKKYFFSGEEKDLNPMALKHIAALTHFDISTVSRITNSKYVQTEFGVFPLKFFFSESIATEDGGEVSNRKIMKTIEEMIDNEDKMNPYSDDQITIELDKLGYKIARRTTAKYRENLNIPPKHLRKLNSINQSI
mgnify:CR=1 FL=1